MISAIDFGNYRRQYIKRSAVLMNDYKTWRMILGILILILAAGYQQNALAHGQQGTLKDSPSATHYYEIDCSDNGTGSPRRLYFAIQNASKAAGAVLSAQVINDDLSMNTSDHTNGDVTTGPPLTVSRQGDNNTYKVLVNKSAAGAVNYSFDYHCETASGAHAGTDIRYIQVQ